MTPPHHPSQRDQFSWPFFEDKHREFATELEQWAAESLANVCTQNIDQACVELVSQLGKAGWLRYAIGGITYGAASDLIDTRILCIARETLSRYSGLADFAFAMQGLGSGAITLFGTPEQKQRYLPLVANGSAICAFALSEPEAGSDVGAMQCHAQFQGQEYIVNGEKTWISNGGIADFYVLFARTGEAAGSRGISAFIVEKDIAGFEVAERIPVIAPHPLARLVLKNCRIPAPQLLGEAGSGFKIAMSTLDVFRTSVAAAALGFARRALDAALERASTRRMFGQTLADFQLTQAKLAEMATSIDAAALLTYRAAWLRDVGKSVTVEAAMAKMTATEMAQRVVDSAMQMFGGQGVVTDEVVERLYREIRPLRIYEGATEVQQLIIGRGILKAFAAGRTDE